MTTTRLVAASGFAGWQKNLPGSRQAKIKTKIELSFGSARSGVLVLLAILSSILVYVYTVNSSAVKGFEIRQAEKEVGELQKQNDQLRIKEAQLQSLYYIEESSKKLNMADLKKVSYVEQKGPMALNR